MVDTFITPPDVWEYTRTYVLASPVAGPAAAAVPPSLSLLLLLLLLLLLWRYSLLRVSQKTQNEKQSVETDCAPRCIAGHEAAAAQQQHSSSTAAAAAAVLVNS